jgi:ATP-dependent helicase/DNAse subunit B
VRRYLILLTVLLLFAATAARLKGQQRPDLTPPMTMGDRNETDARFRDELRRKQEKELNLQRQQRIKKDTDRLLELATELKQNVDKSNENTLSLDVVHKADEIEKLAREIKQKMRDGT